MALQSRYSSLVKNYSLSKSYNQFLQSMDFYGNIVFIVTQQIINRGDNGMIVYSEFITYYSLSRSFSGNMLFLRRYVIQILNRGDNGMTFIGENLLITTELQLIFKNASHDFLWEYIVNQIINREYTDMIIKVLNICQN